MPSWAIELVVGLTVGLVVALSMRALNQGDARRAANVEAIEVRLERIERKLNKVIALLAYVSPRAARLLAGDRDTFDDRQEAL